MIGAFYGRECSGRMVDRNPMATDPFWATMRLAQSKLEPMLPGVTTLAA
jgi:hypothetical protein